MINIIYFQVQAAIDEKVNLKRSLSTQNDNITAPLLKKRGEILLNKSNSATQKSEMNTQSEKDDEDSNPPSVLPANTRIQQLYHSHTKLQARHKKITLPKRAKARALTTQEKIEKKMVEKLQTPLKVDSEDSEDPMLMKIDNALSSPPLPLSSTQTLTTLDGQVYSPQIATSKKDIATNLTKLNFNTPQSVNVVFTQQPSESQQNIVKTQTMITSTPKLIQSTSNLSQHTLKMIPQPNFKISQNQLIAKGAKMINTSIVESNKLIGTKLSFTTQNSQQKSAVPVSPKPVIPLLSTTSIISPSTLNVDTSGKYSKSSPLHSSVVPNLTIPDLTGKASQQKLLANIGTVKSSSGAITSTPTVIATNINNPPKVQILNQQIIHSPNHLLKPTLTPPIKITAQNNFPMKTIQGKASHIKLMPSSGMNKVVIKSNATNKIAGITQLKSLTPISSTFQGTTTNIVTTPAQSYQKVQLMPIKSTPGDGSGKSNLIVMQKLNQLPSSTMLRSVKFPKDMNKIILNSRNIISSPSSVQIKSNNNNAATQQSTLNPLNNVIVLGMSESTNDKTMNKIVNEKNLSSVITEDTPVDILTSNSPPNLNTQIILNGSGELEATAATNQSDGKKTTTLILNASKEIEETDWEVELDQQNKAEQISRSIEMDKRKSTDANEDAGYDDDDEGYDLIEEDCGSIDSEAYTSDVIVNEREQRKFQHDGDDEG